jgi:hypothetical protein
MLKEAAKELNINYSTAKTILRIWRIENRIHKKYTPNKKKKRFRILRANESNSRKVDFVVSNPLGFDIPGGRGVGSLSKILENSFSIEKSSDYGSTLCSNEGKPVVDKNVIKLIIFSYARLLHKSIEELQVVQYGRILKELLLICKYLVMNLDLNVLNESARNTVNQLIGN